MHTRSKPILLSLLLICMWTYSTGQTLSQLIPSSGERIRYESRQDSIHKSWSNGGELGVFVPIYTFRQTVYNLRRGRTCAIEKRELAKQLVAYQQEVEVLKFRMLDIQKIRIPIVQPIEVKLIQGQRDDERVRFDADRIAIKSDYESRIYRADVLTIKSTVPSEKRKSRIKGFLTGFGMGGLAATLLTIALR